MTTTSTSTWLLASYGVVLIGGGLMGLRTAKSKQSAIAGGICGGISIIAAVINALGHPKWAALIVGILGWAVTIMFVRRYQKTKKLMPAAPLIVISMAIANFMVYRFFTMVGH